MFCIGTFYVIVDLTVQDISHGTGSKGEKRIVHCSQFIPALPKQRPSEMFSKFTPACQVSA